MTVECENCKTRVHVADARIPAKGARVRCSRCHHRFHITPSYVPPSRVPEQGSAAEPLLGGEAAREEDQLDFALNPKTSPPLQFGAEHTVNKLLHPFEAPTGLQETDVRSE